MPARRARELLADTLNRVVRTRASALTLVEKGIAANGPLGRMRNAQVDARIDVLDRLADFLGVQPWQILHPDPRVSELSADAIEAGRQLDKLTDPELKRRVYATWQAALHLVSTSPDDALELLAGAAASSQIQSDSATSRADQQPTKARQTAP